MSVSIHKILPLIACQNWLIARVILHFAYLYLNIDRNHFNTQNTEKQKAFSGRVYDIFD
jgi:hypothetical protein